MAEGPTEDASESKLLEPYMGAMRITIHVKNDFERAIRIVVDPKSDTWEAFLAEVLTKLKIRTDVYSIFRASSKTTITSISQIRCECELYCVMGGCLCSCTRAGLPSLAAW